MRQLLALAAIVLVLTGCESTKYVHQEVFGTKEQQREFGTFQDKTVDPNSSAAAKGDDWVKNHLW